MSNPQGNYPGGPLPPTQHPYRPAQDQDQNYQQPVYPGAPAQTPQGQGQQPAYPGAPSQAPHSQGQSSQQPTYSQPLPGQPPLSQGQDYQQPGATAHPSQGQGQVYQQPPYPGAPAQPPHGQDNSYQSPAYPGASPQPLQGQGQSYQQPAYPGPPVQPPQGPYQNYQQQAYASTPVQPQPGQYQAPTCSQCGQTLPPQQQQPVQGQYGVPTTQAQGPQQQQQQQQGYPVEGQPAQGQYMAPPIQGQGLQQQPYPPQGQPPIQQQQPPQGALPSNQTGVPQNQQHVIPVAPSVGYVRGQKASGDATKEAETLRKAMKGLGTDEDRLIDVLVKPDPLQMALIRDTYTKHIGRDLETDLKKETSSELEVALVGLASGPLGLDVRHLKKSFSGIGTDEDALDDILLSRSNADMKVIKEEYLRTYRQPLESALKSDLSGKTEKLFLMIISANRPEPGTPFDRQSVDADVREIHQATEGREGTDEIAVCSIFVRSTAEKLREIDSEYMKKYYTSLAKVIKSEFSGHMEGTLLSILERAKDPNEEMATRLRALVTSPVMNSDRLIYWVVRLHWYPAQFKAVKDKYVEMYAASLRTDILAKLAPGHLKTMMDRLLK